MCELVRIKINMAVSYQLLGKSKWIAHIRTMPRPDSNRGHSDLQPDALPTELLGLVGGPDAIRTHEFRHCPMVTSIQIEPQTGWRRLAGLCPSGQAMMMGGLPNQTARGHPTLKGWSMLRAARFG